MEKEKIAKALEDLDFLNDLLDMQTSEEVQKVFKEKGMEISLEDVNAIADIINKIIEKDFAKLNAEDLDKISGGINNPIIKIKEKLKRIKNFPRKILP